MKLDCPDCRSSVKSTDVNLDRMLATCSSCHSVFSFADKFPTASASRTVSFERPEIARPSSIKVTGTAKGLTLESGWFNFSYIPMAFFCVAWDAFLINWYVTVLTTKGPWIAAVFPVAHVAVGIGLTYSTLAGFLNTTKVDVHRDSLTVEHGPIPWRGNRRIPVLDLEQLYCKEKVSTSRNGVQRTFAVMAILRSSEQIELLTGIDEQEKALFIEQQVERHLGITDRPVPGELVR